MNVGIVQRATLQFGLGIQFIETSGTGLINHSFKVNYPDAEQNLNRALNQLILLEKPETFLEERKLQ